MSYKRGSKSALIISYDIYLKNGKIVHTSDSEDFFDNIINLDNIMRSENIVIDRQKIVSNDYKDFERQYKGAGRTTNVDRLEVVLKIFDK